MMKRLTKRENDGSITIENATKIAEAFARLADYEDTGLEPQEITETQEWMRPISFNRIREIMNAEAEGRLVVLPCKVGDIVYLFYPARKSIYEAIVDEINLSQKSNFIVTRNLYFNRRQSVFFEQFGKTLFLTREEAEEALRRKNDEN